MEIEITENEKQKLQSYINPDDPQEKKYIWTTDYQQSVLGMLLSDKVFLIQSVQLIKPYYFKEKAHELICNILFSYFEKYKQLPPKHVILNEISEIKKNDPKRFYYEGEVEACIGSYVPGIINRDAYLDRIVEFAREQALRVAISSSLDMITKNQANKFDKIREVFKKALMVDRDFDQGLDYLQTLEERYKRMAESEKGKEVFKIGFPTIEKKIANGGLCRGEIGAFMALPGVGKSLMLVKSSIQSLLRDKKVLYISLEMDPDKIARRFDSMISQEDINALVSKRDIVIERVKDTFSESIDKKMLIIKQFPAGTANVDTIRAYMAQLKLYGFKPDLLAVDYVGEMKDIEGIKTYESRQRLVRDLRGFGVEEDHCTLTAMQPNRRGREQQDEGGIDDDSLGDSFGQARPLDALWSINQNHIEKKMGVGRIFVVKHRDGMSRFTIHFKQNRETLNMEEIEDSVYYDIMSQYKQKKGEEGEHIKSFKPGEK